MSKPRHLQDKVECCAKLLLDRGAKVNARDRHHMTALLYACQAGHTGLAKLLLSVGAEVNAKDVRGWTVSFKNIYIGGLFYFFFL